MSFNLAHQVAARQIPLPNPRQGGFDAGQAQVELHRKKQQQAQQYQQLRQQQEQQATAGITEEKERQQRQKQAQLQSQQEVQTQKDQQAEDLQDSRQSQSQSGLKQLAKGTTQQLAGRGAQAAGKGMTKAGGAVGGAVGKAGGAVAGGGIGAVGGAVAGGVAGLAAGGVGALPGALAGAKAGASMGAKTGSQVAGAAGKQLGKMPGQAVSLSGKRLSRAGQNNLMKGALGAGTALPMQQRMMETAQNMKKAAVGLMSGDTTEAMKEASRWTLTTFWGSVWLDYTFLSLLYLHAHLAASFAFTKGVCQFGEDYLIGKWMPKELAKWVEILLLFIIDVTLMVILVALGYIGWQLSQKSTIGWFASWVYHWFDTSETIGAAVLDAMKNANN